MVEFLLYFVLAVVVLLAAAFMMPFAVKFEAVLHGPLHWTVSVQPFGRYGPILRIPRSRKKEKQKQTKSSSKPSDVRLRNADRLFRAAVRLVADLLGTLRIRDFFLDARFGCEDPSETGYIFGVLTPLIYGTSGIRRVYIHVEPVFGEAVLEGRAKLDVLVVPMTLLPPFVRFGWRVFGPSA